MLDKDNNEMNLGDWFNVSGQDKASIAQDIGIVENVFMDRSKGDFRLHKTSDGINAADDKGPIGIRWPEWRWKLFVEKWSKLNLE